MRKIFGFVEYKCDDTLCLKELDTNYYLKCQAPAKMIPYLPAKGTFVCVQLDDNNTILKMQII